MRERRKRCTPAFKQPWIESKAANLDEGTASRYAEELELHELPALGAYFYDALRQADVQTWVNERVRGTTSTGKSYEVQTVRSWYRVFRTMTRDAIVQLDLPRDCTARINFADPIEREETNALTPEELSKFLDAMRENFPRNYALKATLAFTGLRFCHASGIRWEDIDDAKGVIRIVRKHIRGRVGPVSRRKRAPREYPLVPELAAILREHKRELMVEQPAAIASGWAFPSMVGTLRCSDWLWKAWQGCLKAIELDKRLARGQNTRQ